MAQMSSVYSLYSTNEVGMSLTEIGYLYAINGIIVVALQLPLARFIVRFRMTTVTAVGALVYAVGYFSVAFASDFWMLAGSMVVITMGEVITSPSSMNLVANLSPENERGRYMGIFGLFTSTGWSLGPFVGGILYDAFNTEPYLLWGGVALFAIVSAIGYFAMRAILSEKLDRVGGRGAKVARKDYAPNPRWTSRMKVIGVFTNDFRFFYEVVKLLKERGEPFVSLGRTGTVPPSVGVVITTSREKESIRFGKVVGLDDPEEAINTARCLLAGGTKYRTILVGIDPGKSTGLAIFGEGKLLASETVGSPEQVAESISRLLKMPQLTRGPWPGSGTATPPRAIASSAPSGHCSMRWSWWTRPAPPSAQRSLTWPRQSASP